MNLEELLKQLGESYFSAGWSMGRASIYSADDKKLEQVEAYTIEGAAHLKMAKFVGATIKDYLTVDPNLDAKDKLARIDSAALQILAAHEMGNDFKNPHNIEILASALAPVLHPKMGHQISLVVYALIALGAFADPEEALRLLNQRLHKSLDNYTKDFK